MNFFIQRSKVATAVHHRIAGPILTSAPTCTIAPQLVASLLHDFRSSSTPHCALDLSQHAEAGPILWQCSKGETKCAIRLALTQRHPSSPRLRSSVGGVGWPPQWAPFLLAQMPSPPQPPPSVQRSFSLSPNKLPRRQPSPSVLRNNQSPTAPSGPVMRTTPSDVAPLVLHGRHLNKVSVSTATVRNSAVDEILVARARTAFPLTCARIRRSASTAP